MDYKELYKEALDKDYDLSICALIKNKQGEVLLLQRSSDDNFSGIWELPGGGINPGEDVMEALIREIHEETQLESKEESIKFLDYFEFHNIEKNKHKRKFCFVCNIDGEPKVSNEHNGYLWFKKEYVDENPKKSQEFVDSYKIEIENKVYPIWITHYDLILRAL